LLDARVTCSRTTKPSATKAVSPSLDWRCTEQSGWRPELYGREGNWTAMPARRRSRWGQRSRRGSRPRVGARGGHLVTALAGIGGRGRGCDGRTTTGVGRQDCQRGAAHAGDSRRRVRPLRLVAALACVGGRGRGCDESTASVLRTPKEAEWRARARMMGLARGLVLRRRFCTPFWPIHPETHRASAARTMPRVPGALQERIARFENLTWWQDLFSVMNTDVSAQELNPATTKMDRAKRQEGQKKVQFMRVMRDDGASFVMLDGWADRRRERGTSASAARPSP
ncbi:hypothetical protein FB451DRAFT_1465425, partial [Mycena latifolia]